MKVFGKAVAAVAIGVAGFLLVVPSASAAPAPIGHGQVTAGHIWID